MTKAILAAYIFYLVGTAAAMVDQMPKHQGEPYPWWLPFALFVILATPAALGYFAGKEDREPNERHH